MSRYKRGTLERAVQDIFFDMLTARLGISSNDEALQGDDEVREFNVRTPGRRQRNKGRGKVIDPSKDKRLKQNREIEV